MTTLQGILVSALLHKQLDLVHYVLSNNGAVIDDIVAATAVKVALLPVFEVLLSHR